MRMPRPDEAATTVACGPEGADALTEVTAIGNKAPWSVLC